MNTSNILKDLRDIMNALNIKSFTAYFPVPDKTPEQYAVIIPGEDDFGPHADNFPIFDKQRAQIRLFSRGSYMDAKYRIIAALFKNNFKIPRRVFVGYDPDTAVYEYAIDVEKAYGMQKE